MRKFGLLRRFSRLVHRRTKSDATIILPMDYAPPDFLPRSYSLGNIVDDSDWNFTYSATSPSAQTINVRISQLELENAQLRTSNEILGTQTAHSNKERNSVQSDLPVAPLEKLQALFAPDMEKQLALYGEYFDNLRSAGSGLAQALVMGPLAAIGKGEDFEEALVNAIRDMASKPRSVWSKLLPPVIGPRTADQLDSALSSLARARKELRDTNNAARFWRATAKRDGRNEGVITPSSSNISDIREAITEERKAAVDALLAKLRGGEIPVRSQVLSQVEDTTSSETVLSTSISTSSSRRSSLPPLASDLFKEELIASHSSERFSLSKRRGSVDLKTRFASMSRSESAACVMSSQVSSEELVDRRVANTSPKFLNQLHRHVPVPYTTGPEVLRPGPSYIPAERQPVISHLPTSPTIANPAKSMLPVVRSRLPRKLSISSPVKIKAATKEKEGRAPAGSLPKPTVSSSLKVSSPSPKKTKGILKGARKPQGKENTPPSPTIKGYVRWSRVLA